MTKSYENFTKNVLEGHVCLENFARNNETFALRYVWIISISSLDLYLTELISEVGLNLISRPSPILTSNS